MVVVSLCQATSGAGWVKTTTAALGQVPVEGDSPGGEESDNSVSLTRSFLFGSYLTRRWRRGAAGPVNLNGSRIATGYLAVGSLSARVGSQTVVCAERRSTPGRVCTCELTGTCRRLRVVSAAAVLFRYQHITPMSQIRQI